MTDSNQKMFNFKYFKWLQKDAPVGEVEKFPLLTEKGETTLRGCYVAGDLKGVPLLKMAAESGASLVRQFCYEKDFNENIGKDKSIYDIIIIGAGPAGVSAAIECHKRKLTYLLLEANNPFTTIENFPTGKPILTYPENFPTTSAIPLKNGTKESLLSDLKALLQEHDLKIQTNTQVEKISRQGELLSVQTKNNPPLLSQRVILAIGKTGNAKKLGIPGEDLPKVSNRLYDPSEFHNKNILVVGAGDAAVETATALAKYGNKVTLSHRQPSLSKPKEENLTELNTWKTKGHIQIIPSSSLQKITEEKVLLKTSNGEEIFENDQVFVMIGRELPKEFLRRSGIKLQGEKESSWYIFLITMLSFFSMVYFGKSGLASNILNSNHSLFENVTTFLTTPFKEAIFSKGLISGVNFLLGWMGAILFFIFGAISLGIMLRNRHKYFNSPWHIIKYSYLIVAALFFTGTYLHYHFMAPEKAGWIEGTTYSYSLLYCTTMLVFGLRRIYVKKTRYITLQMSVLLFIQIFFLFLLPFHLYPYLENFLGKEHLIIREIFPNGKWSSFAIILFWPLNMWEFGNSTFWTFFPIIQTFIILPWLILKWGKGSYCGWICSCGGMAESLGDEYRTLAPHGVKAKKWENLSQYILLFAFLTTILISLTHGSPVAEGIKQSYKFFIDIIFAGVAGLGLYFFFGGRIWCRFGCPLAALMNIYNKFSSYRIFAEKKKCISCNVCTTVCHMGIDVMNFANQGKPMDDVQCVRCSACIVECPMDVLSFPTKNKD